MIINRKTLLSCKEYNISIEGNLTGVAGVFVIPSRRKHESGWAMMDLIATFYDGREPVHFSSFTDDVSFCGTGFRMDCDWPSGIIHIWNSHEQGKGFNVRGCSSMMFEEVQG